MSYRLATVLVDPETGQSFDYMAKGRLDENGFGVTHTEVLAPERAAPWVFDVQTLLNRSMARDTRKDAQLFRELEISLPRELSHEDHKALVRAFVQRHCVAHGMVAVVALHNERASDGGENPHAHIILTMRHLEAEGFGLKNRAWHARGMLKDWREGWADLANEFFAARGIAKRLDHRSFKDRKIELEPDVYVGPAKTHGFEGVISDQRQADRAAAKARNLERTLAAPTWILDQITRLQSTFTASELAGMLVRYLGLTSRDPRFQALLADLLASPDVIRIASDIKGPARYTTRSVFECEVRLAKTAGRLVDREEARPFARGLGDLSAAQRDAALYLMQGGDLRLLEGAAGTGKTHLLAAVASAYRADGRRVRGVALSAIVARNLGEGIDAPSQTLASLLKDMERPEPFAPLQRGDVVVLDEAGMVGSRQMEKLLGHVERAGAKLILVGDARQLQSIEAGAAFRALRDRFGAARLDDVRRQQEPWQRQASQAFGAGRTAEAVSAYRANGRFHVAETTPAAMAELVSAWMRDRWQGGDQIILAHRRADAAKLNTLVRSVMRAEGRLGKERKIKVTVAEELAGELVERTETRAFAAGDRVLFTRNDRTLGVQNGALGLILAIFDNGLMQVRMQDGRQRVIDPRLYNHLEQGYALTVHKAQGVTADRAYVLATDTFDAHLAYVAMTRHRASVDLFYGRDQFANDPRLLSILTRERMKDTTLDYEARKRAERDLPSPPHGPPAVGEIQVSAADRRRALATERIAQAAQAMARERGVERE